MVVHAEEGITNKMQETAGATKDKMHDAVDIVEGKAEDVGNYLVGKADEAHDGHGTQGATCRTMLRSWVTRLLTRAAMWGEAPGALAVTRVVRPRTLA